MQITQYIPYSECAGWFVSFDAFTNPIIGALADNRVLGGGSLASFGQYSASKVYTTAHAPISYGGQSWLARHDNVRSEPSLTNGSDWFLECDEWVAQDYPLDYIVKTVEGTERYWRKVADTPSTVMPSQITTAGWRRLEDFNEQYYTSSGVDIGDEIIIPLWSNGTEYDAGTIVKYGEDSFFICLASGTGDTPGACVSAELWEELAAYDEEKLAVDKWENGIGYGANSVVKYADNIYIALSTILVGDSAPDVNPQWQSVEQYDAATAVRDYQSNASYGLDDFVRYDKLYYIRKKIGSSKFPNDPTGDWVQVRDWFGASGGVEPWAAKNYTIGSGEVFVEYLSNVYRLIKNIPNQNAAGYPNQATNYWQIVPRWSSIIDANPVVWNSPDFVCTRSGGGYIVWKLDNPGQFSATNLPAPPADNVSYWNNFSQPCTSTYVYTEESGRILLWKMAQGKTSTSNAPPSADWELQDYRTGNQYVYTMNSAGVVKVWYSASESSFPPSSGRDWKGVYSSHTAPFYTNFYVNTANGVFFYRAVVNGVKNGEHFVADYPARYILTLTKKSRT